MQRLSLGEHEHNKNKYPNNNIQIIWENEKKKHSKVLLMKIGKFYEALHQDADILHKEFHLLYMNGKIARTGFPETSLDKFIGDLKKKNYEYHLVLCCHNNTMDEYQQILKEKGYEYSVRIPPKKKRKRPYHIYQNSDRAFYKWWTNIYQEDMDLYEKFSKPNTSISQRDHIKWGKLRAYYNGLCDGRKRVNDGPYLF